MDRKVFTLFSSFSACSETLFFIDGVITDEGFYRRRKSLLEFAISDRQGNLHLWLLTQSYSAVPKI